MGGTIRVKGVRRWAGDAMRSRLPPFPSSVMYFPPPAPARVFSHPSFRLYPRFSLFPLHYSFLSHPSFDLRKKPDGTCDPHPAWVPRDLSLGSPSLGSLSSWGSWGGDRALCSALQFRALHCFASHVQLFCFVPLHLLTLLCSATVLHRIVLNLLRSLPLAILCVAWPSRLVSMAMCCLALPLH